MLRLIAADGPTIRMPGIADPALTQVWLPAHHDTAQWWEYVVLIGCGLVLCALGGLGLLNPFSSTRMVGLVIAPLGLFIAIAGPMGLHAATENPTARQKDYGFLWKHGDSDAGVYATKAEAVAAAKWVHASGADAISRPYEKNDPIPCISLCGKDSSESTIEGAKVNEALTVHYGLKPVDKDSNPRDAYRAIPRLRAAAADGPTYKDAKGQPLTCAVAADEHRNAASELVSEKITAVGCVDAKSTFRLVSPTH